MAKSDGKLFAVQIKGGTAIRLVKARGPEAARNFIARGMVDVRPARPDEVYRMAQSGTPLEDAMSQPEPAPVASATLKGAKTH